jgi:hypothetical protein
LRPNQFAKESNQAGRVSDLRLNVWMVVKDANASIGSNIIVTNSGAFTIAEATIAVAHRREVMILIFLICVITAVPY